jgi:type III secretion protein J
MLRHSLRHADLRYRSLLCLGVLVALLTLSACGGDELYSRLSEREANEMVAVLINAGLPASKHVFDKETFSITISSRHFAQAVQLLQTNGYPRERFDNLGGVFKKEGFVSSPLEERARLVYALSQEIANTLSGIDGVVMARVHLAVPEKDPLSDKAKPSSASVFIKHRRGIDLSDSVSQIKALVVNGVESLPYENVTVALFPAESWPAPREQAARITPSITTQIIERPELLAGFVGGTALLGGGGVWWWRRRKRGGLPAPVQDRDPRA